MSNVLIRRMTDFHFCGFTFDPLATHFKILREHRGDPSIRNCLDINQTGSRQLRASLGSAYFSTGAQGYQCGAGFT